MSDVREWLKSPGSLRIVLYAVAVLDVLVTAAVWWSAQFLPGAAYVIGGVFVLFPMALLFGVGIPTAFVLAIQDARRHKV